MEFDSTNLVPVDPKRYSGKCAPTRGTINFQHQYHKTDKLNKRITRAKRL